MLDAAFAPSTDRLAALCKALAHPARLRILRVLAARETCICGEIVDVMPLAQSTVSRHLKVLKDAGLVQGTVDGPRSCYCLAPSALADARAALGALFDDLDVPPPPPSSHSSCC